MSRNIIKAFNVLVILGLLVFSFIVYADLPAEIPSHINFEGKADSFTEKSLIVWLLIPFLSIFLTAVFYWINFIIDRKPRWINVPHKQKYLELSEKMRAGVNQYLKTFILISGFMLNVILFEVQLMFYQAAISTEKQAETLNTYLLLFFATIFIIYMFVYLFKFSSMIKAAWETENKPA